MSSQAAWRTFTVSRLWRKKLEMSLRENVYKTVYKNKKEKYNAY